MEQDQASERVVITRRDQLELQPWRIPAPAANQVLVRVAYSAVSFGDVMLRRHVFRRRPAVAVPGYEVVGQIEAVGPGVTGMQPGDRVAAFIEYGGNARHALVHARDIVALPVGVDDLHAAAAVLNYATAAGLIEAAGLVAGDDLVVQGASGGVGSAVLDMARALGLQAIGTTRGNARADLFGARLLDARSPSLVDDVLAASEGGVRAAFDSRAGAGLWRSRAMVRRGGSLIVFGLSAVAERGPGAALGTVASLASLALFRALPRKRFAMFRIDQTYRRAPARVRAWVARALALLAAGAIAPIVSTTLPLEEVAEAHRLLETGQIVGKVVLDCQ
jgi:NADPH:quinone reductase-like Zn-dependent oxidoreductase